MSQSKEGLRPEQGYLEKQMERMYELSEGEMPEYRIVEYGPLLDSSDLVASDWLKIGNTIEANYNDYDGFVILHGTDTMAYSSSALPFILEGLSKPVILTGAQIPLGKVLFAYHASLLFVSQDPLLGFRIPKWSLNLK